MPTPANLDCEGRLYDLTYATHITSTSKKLEIEVDSRLSSQNRPLLVLIDTLANITTEPPARGSRYLNTL